MPKRGPTAVDRHVGAKLRAVRVERRLSQGALADKLGITFQQVQKYERGTNRLSASKIWEAARMLKVAPGFFFDGLGPAPGSTKTEGTDTAELLAFIGRNGGANMLNALRKMPPKVAAHIMQLTVQVGNSYK